MIFLSLEQLFQRTPVTVAVNELVYGSSTPRISSAIPAHIQKKSQGKVILKLNE